jgi:hypothetical protein
MKRSKSFMIKIFKHEIECYRTKKDSHKIKRMLENSIERLEMQG